MDLIVTIWKVRGRKCNKIRNTLVNVISEELWVDEGEAVTRRASVWRSDSLSLSLSLVFHSSVAEMQAENDEKFEEMINRIGGLDLQWHQGYMKYRNGGAGSMEWPEYLNAISAGFSNEASEDPMADMKNLWQTGSARGYMDEFDCLWGKLDITEQQAISFFLGGLRAEIQYPVRMFKPKVVLDAFSLAKLQEAANMAMGIITLRS